MAMVSVEGLPSAPIAASAASRRLRILLVIEDYAVRDATGMLLRADGYQVTAVGSRLEALSHADGGEPVDRVVTDFPGMRGVQLVAALREVLGSSLRAVFFSHESDPDCARNLLRQIRALVRLEDAVPPDAPVAGDRSPG